MKYINHPFPRFQRVAGEGHGPNEGSRPNTTEPLSQPHIRLTFEPTIRGQLRPLLPTLLFDAHQWVRQRPPTSTV
jgi:hypothetical protein